MKGNNRNKPCFCGSGKKHKICLCWQIELAHEEALREYEYRKNVAIACNTLPGLCPTLAQVIGGPFR